MIIFFMLYGLVSFSLGFNIASYLAAKAGK